MSERLLQAAYVAGFIDGEGCIRIQKTPKGTSVLMIQISQNDPSPLVFIHKLYGGYLFPWNAKGHTPAFRLSFARKAALDLLIDIEPFLINKKAQAQVAIEFETKRVKGRVKRKDRTPLITVESEFINKINALNSAHRKQVVNS